MTNTKTTETEFDFSVFGKKEGKEIYVPECPIIVRNNCQSGRWVIDQEEFDGKGLQIAILKLTRLQGAIGMSPADTEWGQIWFVAEAGDLPLGMVMCTYVKTQSLSGLKTLGAIIGNRGVEAAAGLFIPTFEKASTMKPDENGTLKPANYYFLKWAWKPRETPEEKERLAPFVRLMKSAATDPLVRYQLTDFDREKTLLDLTPQRDVAPALKSAEATAALPAAESVF